MLDLSGRVALVTGASRGIGLAVAQRLAGAGATVIINARHIEAGLADEIARDRPGSVVAIEGAVDRPETVRALIKQVFSRFKRLDILVNNAGIMRSSMMGMISDDEIEEVTRINLCGVLHITQAASRLMARTGGSIINVSSIVGREGAAGQMVYAASKAGVIGATYTAAKELAPKGIRVNAIAPGFIETKMTDDLGESLRAKTQAAIGMGRPGRPDEVADTVLFLASDMSRYVTGQVIGVDGGLVI